MSKSRSSRKKQVLRVVALMLTAFILFGFTAAAAPGGADEEAPLTKDEHGPGDPAEPEEEQEDDDAAHPLFPVLPLTHKYGAEHR